MYRCKSIGSYAYAFAAVFLLALAAWPSAAWSRAPRCVHVTERQIANLFARWNDALQASTPEDPGPVVALYASNAVLLPTVENGPYTNHAEIKKYFEHFLENKPSGAINRRIIRIGCNMAFDAGLYTFTYQPPPPKPPKDPTYARYTYVYEYVRGRWLIAHHHSSVRPEPPKP